MEVMMSQVREMLLDGRTDYLPLCAAITFGMQMFFCLIAAPLKTDKLTDFAGCTNVIILAVMTYLLGKTPDLRQLAVTAMASVWGIRLVSYLVRRIFKMGHDERFNEFRKSFLKTVMFWIMQAVWVLVVSLPVIVLNSTRNSVSQGSPAPLTMLDIAGAAIYALGMLIEIVADSQKFSFRMVRTNKGKFCKYGLWRFSRHPNYFGEMLIWWGIFTVTSNVLQGLEWSVIASPIFATFLLLFVSGIPPLEKLAEKKYGNMNDYKVYKKCTSPLVPLPPSFYRILPSFLKMILFFEFPFYNNFATKKLSSTTSKKDTSSKKNASPKKDAPKKKDVPVKKDAPNKKEPTTGKKDASKEVSKKSTSPKKEATPKKQAVTNKKESNSSRKQK